MPTGPITHRLYPAFNGLAQIADIFFSRRSGPDQPRASTARESQRAHRLPYHGGPYTNIRCSVEGGSAAT